MSVPTPSLARRSLPSPNLSLLGKVAVVTGASRGIGQAIAIGYARAGADVAILARDQSRLEDVAAEIESQGRRALVLSADVTDEAAVREAVGRVTAELGGLHVVVNNAGGNSFSVPIATMRPSGWSKTQVLNVDSVFHVSQVALPQLVASGGGSIINVASVAGLQGAPYMAHYAAAKAAVISLTQSLAIEVASRGVRVNALVPGWIATDLTEFLRGDESTEAALLDRVPMKRWGTAEEMVGPALFLACEESSFMTGQTLVVDGGLSAMP